MAISVLQLPVDIPWRRVGASMYMIDADVCDRRKPLEMLPSVAVIRYDPADESYDLGDDLAVSYLKVTCSITSYKRLIGLIRNLRDVITARGAWRLSRSREGGLPEVMREHEPILIYLRNVTHKPQRRPCTTT